MNMSSAELYKRYKERLMKKHLRAELVRDFDIDSSKIHLFKVLFIFSK